MSIYLFSFCLYFELYFSDPWSPHPLASGGI